MNKDQVPDIVYFHRDLDGVAAARAIWRALPLDVVTAGSVSLCAPPSEEAALNDIKLSGVLFRSVNYGEAPDLELCTGRRVLVVDFCWPLETLQELREACEGLVVLDHHRLSPEVRSFPGVIVDTSKAGCRLAWEYCQDIFSELEVPDYVRFVEDRDLWRFQFEETRPYVAYLGRCVFDGTNAEEGLVEALDRVVRVCSTDEIEHKGRLLLCSHDDTVRRCANSSLPCRFEGNNAMLLTLPYGMPNFISDVGSKILEDNPEVDVAVIVRLQGHPLYAGHSYFVSLRARTDGVDVASLAKLHGGGGHKSAAGFSTTQDTWGGFVDAPDAELYKQWEAKLEKRTSD